VISFFAFALLLAASLRIAHKWQSRTTSVSSAGLLAGSLVIASFPFSPAWSAGMLELSVLDVGQGDSLFVVSPGGKTLLIDGGGAFAGFGGQTIRGIDPGEEAVSPYLCSRAFQKLDVVALTHAHQDHLGGLKTILDNFHVGQLWIGREVRSVPLAKLEQLARDKHIPIEHETNASRFALDTVQGKIFWPASSYADLSSEAKNDDSLVMGLRYQAHAMLLPGDAEKEAEHEILSENAQEELQADVLKIGHHGSKNSTIAKFLEAVKPRVAIISVAKRTHMATVMSSYSSGSRMLALRFAHGSGWSSAYPDEMENDWKSGASFPACRSTETRYERKPQITRKTSSSSKKPTAARYSRFFLYCAIENGPGFSVEGFAGVNRGKKRGTLRAYS
jgi:beta-lactamase superfamily II metal-dependent hydrolase